MPTDKSPEDEVNRLEDEIENNRVAIARLETENRYLREERDRALKALDVDAELRKTHALAEIADRTEGRKHRRELAMKAAAIVTGVIAVVSAALAKC